jgi:hypothetical protein
MIAEFKNLVSKGNLYGIIEYRGKSSQTFL